MSVRQQQEFQTLLPAVSGNINRNLNTQQIGPVDISAVASLMVCFEAAGEPQAAPSGSGRQPSSIPQEFLLISGPRPVDMNIRYSGCWMTCSTNEFAF